MLKVLFLWLMILPLAISAQKIKKSEINGFTDERTIETSIVTLKQGFSTGFGVEFQAINRNYFMSLIGYGRNNKAVNDDDRVQFIMNNGAVVKFNSRVEMPSGDPNIPNVYIHHYYIDLKDIETLKNYMIVIVRITSPQSEKDVLVAMKNGKELSKLSEIFLKEVRR